jgi:hypothetical protein
MPPKILLLGITILSIVIIVGGVAYTLVQNKPAVSPSPSGSGEQTPTGGTTSEVQPQYPEDNSSDTSGNPPTTPDTSTGANDINTPSSNTGASPFEQVRDQGMTFLKNSKAETAALVTNLSWTGGRDDLASVGTERYYYYSSNGAWSIIVESYTNSTSTYTVAGTYNSATMTVSFTETYTNGAYKLTSYSSQKYPQQTQP